MEWITNLIVSLIAKPEVSVKAHDVVIEPAVESPKAFMALLAQTSLASTYLNCSIKPANRKSAEAAAARITASIERYKRVETKTGIPWWVIGCIHSLECSNDFTACLHNGERIIGKSKKTTLVPKGRGPFATWEEASIDALKGRTCGSTLQGALDFLEVYNGVGYRNRHVASPYLFSFTTAYTKGKYVKDGVYDPNAVSGQVGCAAIMKVLEEKSLLSFGAPVVKEPAVALSYQAKVFKLANSKKVDGLAARLLAFMGSSTPRYVSIFDVSKKNTEDRFHVIDTKEMSVLSIKCSVGSGSDKNSDGFPDSFSDKDGTHQTSLGVFRYAETYVGKHGLSCKMDGLEASNKSMRARSVVTHTAAYTTDSRAGNSWGCQAISANHKDLITKLSNGSYGIIGKG